MKSFFELGERLSAGRHLIGLLGNPRLYALKSELCASGSGTEFLEVWPTDFETSLEILKKRLGNSADLVRAAKEGAFLIDAGRLRSLEGVGSEGEGFEYEASERLEEETHEKGRTLVSFEMLHNKTSFQKVTIEIFTREFPKLGRRFLDLCQGIIISSKVSYKEGRACELQPGLYVAFEPRGKYSELSTIEDEAQIYSHDSPGVVGFVKFDERRHSNQANFYVTLDRLKSFDGRFVAIGRVLAGLPFLRGLEDVNLSICDISVEPQRVSRAETRRAKEVEARRRPCPAELVFKEHIHSDRERYLDGPRKISFEGVRTPQAALPNSFGLYTVETLSFVECGREFFSSFLLNYFRFGVSFPALRRLELRNCELGLDDLRRFLPGLDSALFVSVRVPGTPNLLRELRDFNPAFAKMQAIQLDDCRLDAAAFDFLAPRTALPALRMLSVAQNSLFDQGVASLFQKLELPALKSLSLSETNLSARGLTPLHHTRLQNLDISGNFEVDDFLVRLAEGAEPASLRRLDLANTGLKPRVLQAYLDSPRAAFLHTLILDRNPQILPTFASRFGDFVFLSNLRELSLKAVKATNREAGQLAATPRIEQLTFLCLKDNPFLELERFLEEECRVDEIARWRKIARIELDLSPLEAAAKKKLAESQFGETRLLQNIMVKEKPMLRMASSLLETA